MFFHLSPSLLCYLLFPYSCLMFSSHLTSLCIIIFFLLLHPGIFKHSMGVKNQVGTGLSYWPARIRGGGIDALESIPGLLKSLKIRALFSAWPGASAQREGAGAGEPAEEEGLWAQQSEDQNQPASNLAQVCTLCYFTIPPPERLQQAIPPCKLKTLNIVKS